jgi:hypothetical protein
MHNECEGLVNYLTSYFPYIHYLWYRYSTEKLVLKNQNRPTTIPHVGIIIAFTGRKKDDDANYFQGIDLLISYLLMKNIDFNVYVCNNREKTKEIIYNKYVKQVWIFGHGSIDALDFGKNQLDYSDFKEIEEEQKKDFVGQFHCNGKGKSPLSLADYILKKGGKKFVKQGIRCVKINRKAIECCINCGLIHLERNNNFNIN